MGIYVISEHQTLVRPVDNQIPLRATMRRVWKDGFLVRPPEIEPPRDSAPRDRYLTKAEARRLLDACDTPHVRTFMAIAMYTGARKGSILALTWDRVHWETGMIDFQEPNVALTGKRRSVVPMIRRRSGASIASSTRLTCGALLMILNCSGPMGPQPPLWIT